MARDMSNIYYEMLTKELVALKKKKEKRLETLQRSTSYKDLRECDTLRQHINQINAELAGRVAQLSLFA